MATCGEQHALCGRACACAPQLRDKTDQTLASIFVNPAQFAAHEDLGTYPRTLESDLEKLG